MISSYERHERDDRMPEHLDPDPVDVPVSDEEDHVVVKGAPAKTKNGGKDRNKRFKHDGLELTVRTALHIFIPGAAERGAVTGGPGAAGVGSAGGRKNNEDDEGASDASPKAGGPRGARDKGGRGK